MPYPLLNFIAGAVNGDTSGNSANGHNWFSNGLASASEGYDNFITQQNQLQNAGKAADYARKAMGDNAEQTTGIPDEQWANMGSRERAAAIQGVQQKQTLAQILAQTQLMTSRAQTLNNPAPTDPADTNFATALKGMMQPQGDDSGGAQGPGPAWPPGQTDLTQAPAGMPAGGALASRLTGQGQPTAPKPLDVLAAALKAGLTPSDAIARATAMGRLIAAQPGAASAGGSTSGENFFSADPDKMAQDVPGFPGLKRVITGPKTSILRDAQGNVAQPMMDEDGNPIGYGVPTGTGTTKFVPLKDTTAKGTVTDQDQFKAGAAAHAAKVRDAAANVHNFTSIGDTKSEGYTNSVAGYQQALKDQDDFLSGKSTKAPSTSKVATPAIAQQYLQKFGGDKDKARKAAKADGYNF